MGTAMEESKKLKIRMLGEFSIQNENNSLTASKQNGLTSFLLLGYLISNKGNDITSEMLIDILWPEGESNNPSGALRTLLHRTKKTLASFFPDENVDFIRKTNNLYTWNHNAFPDIDIFEFEHFAHKAFRESDSEKQFMLLSIASDLYQGEFLNLFAHHSWVTFRNSYYGNLYIKCINLMCYHLNEREEFEAILDLCNLALERSPSTDETLHKQKIFALLNLNKVQTALDYYYSILSIFNTKYGLDITESMIDVYEAILKHMPNQFQSLNSLDRALRSKQVLSGSFYCNFDIFQNVYQVNLRYARRSKSCFYLLLLTLHEKNATTIMTEDLKKELDILQDVMQRRLRSNDVYTKPSNCQYSLIVNSPDEAGAKIVKNRIIEGYKRKKKHAHISLDVDFKEII